jgi:hypothetical protein
MSSFNILITQVVCPNCGAKQQVRIQFKFGNTWQLQYKLGDKISWGGNDAHLPSESPAGDSEASGGQHRNGS